MVIKTTKHTNKTIVQQLTELMNKAFDSTVTKTLAQNRAMMELKDNNPIDCSFKEKDKNLKSLFQFISSWADKSYYKVVLNYVCALTETNCSIIRHYWSTYSLNYCLDEKTVLEYKNRYSKSQYGSKFFAIEHLIHHQLTPTLKQVYPLYNDSTANSLLYNYQTFKGTAEQAALTLIKPLLISGFIEKTTTELSAIIELIEVINNYHDNDYHFKRFVQFLEQGMVDLTKSDPFELVYVWKLWDEQFLKDKVLPFLKKKELSESQRKSLRSKLYCSDDELLIIKNYYDYCLAYSYASESSITTVLAGTVFLYNKHEFEHALRIILLAIENSDQFYSQDNTNVKLFNQKTNQWFNCSKETLSD